MASSSSSSSSPAAETHIPQCGSGINVANFESSKLRRDGSWNNYKSWKEQMLCLVESQGLLEFIDGVAPPPPPPPSGDDADYVAWRRTDWLVKGWILGALSDEVVQNVIHLDSARDVWLDLENQFSTAQSQQGNLYHPPPPPPSNDTPTPPITNPGATPPPPPEYNYAPPPPPSSYPAAPPPLTGKPGSYPVGPQLNYQLPQDPQQDIALDLVNKYPYLARINNSNSSSALNVIASKDTSFLVEAQLNLWERFVYSCIRLEMESFDTLENSPRWREMVRELHSTLSKVISQLVPGVKKIYEKKLMREQARRLVKCICKHMESLNHEEASSIYRNAMRTAAKSGSHEVVEEIVATFPPAIHSQDDDTNENFLHLAVRNRCEKVFNLLYQATNHRCHYCSLSDTSGNSILHMAAFLAPPHKLNLVSGAALQMQREIQWFKEVHKFASPFIKGRKNKAGKTPEMIFTEAHKKLKEEGEKWMKDTANSCTIAAALIVTVVFAAAITVPGGNESDTGYPMMWENSAFTIFAVSDAVSLFTSATSLLMFLSILTSRYAEQDFLYALPKRLCIGLVTLFLSILFMMAAFSSTLYLVFGRKKAWVLIPVAALTCLPISSFVLLQFPLLIAVISSTYGKGIFGKQSNRPFH